MSNFLIELRGLVRFRSIKIETVHKYRVLEVSYNNFFKT